MSRWVDTQIIGWNEGGPWEFYHDATPPFVQSTAQHFGGDFYDLQPRHGLYVASRWDVPLVYNGSYPSLGSANISAQLRPVIAPYLALTWEMSVNGGTGRIKFYILRGANRDQLTLWTTPGTDVTEVTETNTAYQSKRYIVQSLNEPFYYPNIADAEGEDVEFEIYLENTTNDVRIRNFRIASGYSPYPADFLE